MTRRLSIVGLGAFVLFFLLASIASAQPAPEALVSRDVGYFNPGVDPNSGAPVQTPNNYPAAAAQCGLTKVPPPPTVVNPTRLRFDDPADPTNRDCEIPAATAGGHLASIPFGVGYRAAARSRGANTVSLWSPVSNPFDVARVSPPAPTGVRVLQ